MGGEIPHPMLRKQNRIKTIHSSLAIEYNSLSLEQVIAIVDGSACWPPPMKYKRYRVPSMPMKFCSGVIHTKKKIC